MKSHKTMEMVEIAFIGAVLCVISPFTIPIPASPVPLSLATLGVYLATAFFGTRKAVCGILVYLLLGMAGLPVFSGFSGGIGIVFGPTGGYLMGYVPCAILTGWLMERGRPWKQGQDTKENVKSKDVHRMSKIWNIIAMLFGTLACYGLGTIWFLIIMDGMTIMQAVFLCVVPYLAFDMVKIVLAAYLSVSMKKRLRRMEL